MFFSYFARVWQQEKMKFSSLINVTLILLSFCIFYSESKSEHNTSMMRKRDEKTVSSLMWRYETEEVFFMPWKICRDITARKKAFRFLLIESSHRNHSVAKKEKVVSFMKEENFIFCFCCLSREKYETNMSVSGYVSHYLYFDYYFNLVSALFSTKCVLESPKRSCELTLGTMINKNTVL